MMRVIAAALGQTGSSTDRGRLATTNKHRERTDRGRLPPTGQEELPLAEKTNSYQA